MVIGFHYHLPIRVDVDGSLHTQSFFGLFLDALSRHCHELIVFSYTPAAHEQAVINYRVSASNIRIINLGLHNALPKRLLRVGQAKSAVEKVINDIDIFLVRTPTPLISVFALFRFRKPVIMYLVGDFLKSSGELPPWNPKTWLIKGLGIWIAHTHRKLARQNTVIANNDFLLRDYEGVACKTFLVKSTTLSKSDIFTREDTCRNEVIRILYTGRIDPAKGLFEILEACERISGMKIKVEFHLAGLPVKGFEQVPQQVLQKAEKGLMKNRVFFHGLKKVGPELNALYRNADIYMIASKGMEGFPRTIWEAMANGLPVIASNLGAIPLFLRHGQDALLVEVGNIDHAVEALVSVIKSQGLRQTLITNGYRLAVENTLDEQASRMVSILQDIIPQK